MKNIALLMISLISFLANEVCASELYIRPRGTTVGDIFFADMASSSSDGPGFRVNANISCYGTNLRAVANPLSPTGHVRMSIQLSNGRNFGFVFPGYLAKQDPANITPVTNILGFGMDPVTNLTGVKNTISFRTPPDLESGVAYGVNGNPNAFDVSQRSSLITGVSFVQDMISNPGNVPPYVRLQKPVKDWYVQQLFKNIMRPFRFLATSETSFGGDGGGDGGGMPTPTPAGTPVPTPGGDGGGDGGDGGGGAVYGNEGDAQGVDYASLENNNDEGFGQPRWVSPNPVDQRYMGKDGPITANWSATWSSDFKTLNISAAFPGQNGFCGGYYSPLMLFFNNKRPEYTSQVKFKMNSYSDKTFWPEPSSEGYFLALDRNGDGIINDVSEMFGSEDGHSNGFEILKHFDENNDGVIDAKDSAFSELLLWRDSTGQGKTLKKDVKTLAEMGVTSIRLNYSLPFVITKGGRAEERERAEFSFTKSGKVHKGEVIDVWFATN